MVNYVGWAMPVEYSGIANEHMAVRTRAGLFDVSHMGELEVAGADAAALLQRVTTNDVSRVKVGKAQYTILTTRDGTVLDDLLLYRLAGEHFLLIVNAAFTGEDYRWMGEQARQFADAVVINSSARYALVAIQGPASREVLQPLTGIDLSGIKYYGFAPGEVANVRATITRTGYTGEDGFEILIPPSAAGRVWDALLDAGRSVDVLPAGIGARDTLRLEAGMRLAGVDMDRATTVLEAGLEAFVAWGKGDFIGREALERQRAAGVSRKLTGFEMIERAIARHGYGIYAGGASIGTVTSGTQTPYLKKAIGMGYVPPDYTAPGREFTIDVRGRRARAAAAALPFYKRPRN